VVGHWFRDNPPSSSSSSSDHVTSFLPSSVASFLGQKLDSEVARDWRVLLVDIGSMSKIGGVTSENAASLVRTLVRNGLTAVLRWLFCS
jgi:hypothetical protein